MKDARELNSTDVVSARSQIRDWIFERESAGDNRGAIREEARAKGERAAAAAAAAAPLCAISESPVSERWPLSIVNTGVFLGDQVQLKRRNRRDSREKNKVKKKEREGEI